MQHIPVSTDSGIKVDLIEVNARVSYADLDLKKNADITKLMTRIETSAKE